MTIQTFFTALIAAIPAIGGALIPILINYQKQKAAIAQNHQTSTDEHELQGKKILSMQRDIKKMAKSLEAINAKLGEEASL